jgi:predicted cupin superfamily sugar epimerase
VCVEVEVEVEVDDAMRCEGVEGVSNMERSTGQRVDGPPDAAREIVDRFELEPHPEGGWFRQTFRDEDANGTVHSTAIYFLLARGERSHWHRVNHAAEVWHHYAGDPIRLRLSADGATTEDQVLGTDLASGERPQVIVPLGCWQSAETLGDWTLVGCTVAPGFDFAHFELAPPDWQPGTGLDDPGPDDISQSDTWQPRP